MIVDPRLIAALTRVLESDVTIGFTTTQLVFANCDRVALIFSLQSGNCSISTKPLTDVSKGINIGVAASGGMILAMSQLAGLPTLEWWGWDGLGSAKVHIVEVIYEPWKAAQYSGVFTNEQA